MVKEVTLKDVFTSEVIHPITTDNLVISGDSTVPEVYATKAELKDAIYEKLDFNEHEFVDMGDAGIWAKYPIGITEWNDSWRFNIQYFQWGDTQGYNMYQIGGNNKKFDNNFKDYKFSAEGASYTNPKLTKYCFDVKFGNNGFTDNLTVLEPEDDAAHVNMGGNWRMPTADEFKKLFDSKDLP